MVKVLLMANTCCVNQPVSHRDSLGGVESVLSISAPRPLEPAPAFKNPPIMATGPPRRSGAALSPPAHATSFTFIATSRVPGGMVSQNFVAPLTPSPFFVPQRPVISVQLAGL